MTVEGFIDYCVDRSASLYENGNEPPDEIRNRLDLFWRHAVSIFAGTSMEEAVTRKAAARIIHTYLKDVRRICDTDWNRSLKLRDIYDCRVCANSIAQIYERGIIKEFMPGIFGANELMTDSELEDAFAAANRIREQVNATFD